MAAHTRRVERDDRACADQREVPVPSRHLGEALTGAGLRSPGYFDLHEQFVRLERRREKSSEEVLSPARALTPALRRCKTASSAIIQAGSSAADRVNNASQPSRVCKCPMTAPPQQGARHDAPASQRMLPHGAPSQTPSVVFHPRPATQFRSDGRRTKRMFIGASSAAAHLGVPHTAPRVSTASTVRGAKYSNAAALTPTPPSRAPLLPCQLTGAVNRPESTRRPEPWYRVTARRWEGCLPARTMSSGEGAARSWPHAVVDRVAVSVSRGGPPFPALPARAAPPKRLSRNPARAMRRVQVRGGARWPHARPIRGSGAMSGYRRDSPDRLAHYVARRSRAPAKWALLIALDAPQLG